MGKKGRLQKPRGKVLQTSSALKLQRGSGKQKLKGWKNAQMSKFGKHTLVGKHSGSKINSEDIDDDHDGNDEELTRADSDSEEGNEDEIPSTIRKYGYLPGKRILLVGEGDFSFTLALINELGDGGNLVATAFDSRETLTAKYAKSGEILLQIENSNAVVKFNIDATNLAKSLHIGRKKRKSGELDVLSKHFDRIVFNFPHVGLGIRDEQVNIQKNRELIHGFFISSIPLISPAGEIVVTLKTGMPYQKWNVTGIAQQTGMLELAGTKVFNPSDFEGYKHRRTIGFVEGLSANDNEEIVGQAKTYIFRKK